MGTSGAPWEDAAHALRPRCPPGAHRGPPPGRPGVVADGPPDARGRPPRLGGDRPPARRPVPAGHPGAVQAAGGAVRIGQVSTRTVVIRPTRSPAPSR